MLVPNKTPRSEASHLGLFCLLMCHKRDVRLKLVKYVSSERGHYLRFHVPINGFQSCRDGGTEPIQWREMYLAQEHITAEVGPTGHSIA